MSAFGAGFTDFLVIRASLPIIFCVIIGKIHSVETMGALDGPGLRYVLFLKGCPFRCAFCHNPDTWGAAEYTARTAEEVAADVLKYREFFAFSGGGFTVSGGEPLMQIPFLEELFGILKKEGISIAVDTCGHIENPESAAKIVELADLFLLDIKHLDSAVHQKLTGKPNDRVLAFLEYLNSRGKEIHIRVVLVNGYSADEAYLTRLAEFLKKYRSITRVDLLPYHTLGVPKWESLDIPYRLDSSAALSKEQCARALEIFKKAGFNATLQ